MARRQASCNKTTRTTVKSSSKPLVRRHSKRLQRQQRDLPTLLQDLSCVTSDQVSGEEDSSSILTQSGSEISLQDISRDCSTKVEVYQHSENSSNSEDMLSVLQPQILPIAGCQGPAGGCQAGVTMPWPVLDAPITNETIIAHTDFTTTSEIAKRRMQSKRSKRQRQIRSNSVVSSASSSRSSMASPDIGSCTSENTQLPLTCYSVNGSNANTTMSSLSTSSSSNSVVIQPTFARHDGSTLPQVPIPMYLQQPQQQPQQSTTFSVASSDYSSTGLSHPVLSQLQQELSYRFIKDQGLVQDGAAVPSSGSATMLPKVTTELGSSQSAFQKKVISKWCCAHISIARFIQSHRKQQQQQQAAAVATAEAIAQETLKAAEQEHKNSQHQQFVPSNMICYSHPLATSSAAAGAGLLWQQQHQQTLQQWQQQQSQHPPQLMPTNTSQYQFLQTVPLQAEVTAIAQQQHTNSSNTVLRPMSVQMGHHVILPQGLVSVPSVLQAPHGSSQPYQVVGQLPSQQVQQQPQLMSTTGSTAMGALLINNNHSFITPFQPAFITSSLVK